MPALMCADSVGHVRNYFLARQPILDRNQNLVAYELLFRCSDTKRANVFDNHAATTTVISHVVELGLDNIVGQALAYVNVDESVLHEDFISLLPTDRVVLEILETVVPTPELMRRIAQLRKSGFVFALDDVISATEQLEQLLPVAEVVKVDIYGMDPALLAELAAQLKQDGKQLLAEKVETHEEYQYCLGLGFDYFQGYYFSRPKLLSGTRLSTTRLTIMRLITLLIQEAPSEEIIDCIKQDASMSLKMLRMVNTPMFGRSLVVKSLDHALMLLGRRELQRWMQVLLYADGTRKGSIPPLLALAATRGKLLELLAQQLQHKHDISTDVAFTVGIMSLLDTLLDMPMEDVLVDIGVTDAVKLALQSREGFYGKLLDLVIFSEQFENDQAYVNLMAMLQETGILLDELKTMQWAAYQWSNSILKAA